MSVDYEAIRQANIEEYGKGTRHLAYLSDLYATRTHFIFELLQNTEDAISGLSGQLQNGFAEFRLFADRLELRHNGKPFDEKNVKGICGIGEGTKAGDLTKIGKFGVGFKAVYSYTFAPRIHSDSVNFEIRRFVEPHPIEPREDLDLGTTLIVLPFDGEETEGAFRKRVPPDIAVEEIGKALKNLSPQSLLFLRSTREVRWILPDGKVGTIRKRREKVIDETTTLVQVSAGLKKETWVLFQTETEVEDFQKRKARVEVGFRVKRHKVVRANNTEIVVFFPTKVGTSLGFLIQGPFKTKVSRESLDEDDPSNRELLEAVAQLSTNALLKLKNAGRLGPKSFDALPLVASNYPPESFLHPVYDAVRKALKSQSLILTSSGDFVSGWDARLAGTQKLTELLSPEQLGELFDRGPLHWVHPSSSENFLNYLSGKKKSLHSTEWIQEPLIEGVRLETDAVAKRLTAEFFHKQHELNPAWLLTFFEFLNNHFETFKDVPFVRLETGEFVSRGSADKPNAYLRPSVTSQINQKVFPLVCESLMAVLPASILREKAKLREPDKIETIIRCLLPKYESGKQDFDPAEYANDLEQIDAAYHDEKATEQDRSRLTTALRAIRWVSCVQVGKIQGPIVWKSPADSLVECSDALVQWFDQNTTAEAWFPHQVVLDQRSPEFLKLLGMRSGLIEEQCRHPSFFRDYYVRSDSGFDERVSVVGVKHALANPTQSRSRSLWIWMIESPFKLRGSLSTSSNKQFPMDKTTRYKGPSVVGHHAIHSRWLPRRSDGQFCKPSELLLTDLPEDFEQSGPRAEALSRILSMKQPVDFVPLAEALGATPEQFSMLQQKMVGRSFDSLLAALQHDDDPDLPGDPVPNPTLRRERLFEELQNAPAEEKVLLERTVQPHLNEETARARAYLRTFYTDAEGKMICQCCHHRMPFQVNGLDYFEAIRCVRGFDKHYFENRLALCPNCAAKYRHTRKIKDADLRNYILAIEVSDTVGSVQVPMILGVNEHRLHFIGKHWFDLKTIFAVLEQ